MSSAENNAEVAVEKVAPVEEKAAETKEIKGTKRPAEDKTPESKKAKKEENGSGDSKIVEDETVEEFTDEDEAEDAEYDLPYGEEDDDDDLVEEEEDDEEDGEEYDKDA